MSSSNGEPIIGKGHAKAMFRQGLDELRAAMYTESNVAQPTEYGMYGTPLPSEIAAEHRGESHDLSNHKPATLDERLNDVGREPPEPESRDLERE